MLNKIFTQTLAIALMVAVSSFAVADNANDKAIESFLAHVDKMDSVSAEKKAEIKAAVKEMAADPYSKVDAITEGLGILYPEYKKAVEASLDEDAEANKQFQPLVDSDDDFLAADSAFYLARSLMNAEDFENALPLLEKVTKLSDKSMHGNSAMYFTGVAQAGLLKNKEAMATFQKFLAKAEDAPERLRVSAWRQIKQLETIKKGQLPDIHQRMVFAANRLKKEKSGDITQGQQKEILKMLAKLIKEQEKKECSNCKSNCKNSQQQQAQKPGSNQGKSASAGKSSKGGSSNNPNGTVRREFDNGPASPWSRLRERTRDAANTAVKEKLPAKYRDLVEKYNTKVRGDK